MREIIATVTGRGQVTIPSEVRRRFHLKSGDKIAFTLDDDHVGIRPVEFTLESIFDSIELVPGATHDIEQQIDEATAAAIERDFPSHPDERS